MCWFKRKNKNYITDGDWKVCFPVTLNYWMKKKGVTVKVLAEKMDVSDSTVSRWLKGTTIPKATTLVNMAMILGTTVEELVTKRV